MFDPWLGKIPWRRKWQPTPVFLPGEFHGQREPDGVQSTNAFTCRKICPSFSKYYKKNMTFEREMGVYLGVAVSFMIIQMSLTFLYCLICQMLREMY